MKKQIQFEALDAKPSFFEYSKLLVSWSSSTRINFYIGLAFAAGATVGLVALVVTSNFLTDGAGMFMLLWLLVGTYLIVDSYMQLVRSYKVTRFAASNGFDVIHDILAGEYPSTVMIGNESRIVSAVRTRGQYFVELGNFQLLKVSGRDSRYRTGYVRMKLPRRLPHIMLTSKRNGLAMAPVTDAIQKLSLEGNFDDHFTLYVPNGYRTDALYIFTPDVMESFMKYAKNFTCEIIDDELYLYSSKPLDLTSPGTITAIFTMLEKIAQKFNHQIDYYADQRVGDRTRNVIGQGGQRLSGRAYPVLVSVLVTALIAAIVPAVVNVVLSR